MLKILLQLIFQIVSDEITDVQKKEESINDLIKDADKLAFETETKNGLKLLGRSNDFQRISRTKKRATVDDL